MRDADFTLALRVIENLFKSDRLFSEAVGCDALGDSLSTGAGQTALYEDRVY